MARWEPDAQERLVRAALELFERQGYENTTVVEIASAAGLTKSTFFRHFPDKREVLFAGQDVLCDLLAGGIAKAPGPVSPITAVVAAIEAAGVAFPESRRDIGAVREAVIAGNSELRERNALKQAGFVAAMTNALRERGVVDPLAELAAHLGVVAIYRGYAHWVSTTGTGFAAMAVGELKLLQLAVHDLDEDVYD